jgi:Xaa-Pro aminopeptidase
MGDAPSDEVRAMDEAMDRAIYAAVDRLRVGSTGAEADAAAREVLSGAGYEDYRHGTGHALGFATHDVGAGVNGSADKPFKSGEVVTVEPGIYVEGWGGFRKEVDVVITEDGPVMLNEPAKLVCRKT